MIEELATFPQMVAGCVQQRMCRKERELVLCILIQILCSDIKH